MQKKPWITRDVLEKGFEEEAYGNKTERAKEYRASNKRIKTLKKAKENWIGIYSEENKNNYKKSCLLVHNYPGQA